MFKLSNVVENGENLLYFFNSILIYLNDYILLANENKALTKFILI